MTATVFECDFPAYSIGDLGGGEFYLTGGGGAAKTGVPNVLEVYHLSSDGRDFKIGVLFRKELDREIIMNSAPHPEDRYIVAAGIESKCHLLTLVDRWEEEEEEVDLGGKISFASKGKLQEDASLEKPQGVESIGAATGDKGEGEEEGVRRRKGRQSKTPKKAPVKKRKSKVALKDAEFEVQWLDVINTDSSPTDAFQNVVVWTSDGKRMVTGGCEGVVMSWKYPSLQQDNEFIGHTNEIVDIACNPKKPQCVSVCRGGVAIVWNFDSGKEEHRFSWAPDTDIKYRFRACTFPSSSSSSSPSLFTINIPINWNSRSPQPCYLMSWNPSSWQPRKIRKTGKTQLFALAVSPSGERVAVGTEEGSIEIFNNSLGPLQKVKKAHGLFVTRMAFIHVDTSKQKKASKARTALVSISADKTICAVPMQSTTSTASYCGCLLIFLLIPVLIILVAMATGLLPHDFFQAPKKMF